jgi:hypothetical protein
MGRDTDRFKTWLEDVCEIRGQVLLHLGVEFRANHKSISHRCHLFEVASVWELTQETIYLPLGCPQGGLLREYSPA